MSKLKIFGGLFLFMFILLLGSCAFTKVGQGHVGVKVNNIGSGAGVDMHPKGVGWYFTPPGVSIYEYPIYTNNYTWKDEERFTFQDKNGLSVSADVSVAYRANPALAPVLFQKYRTGIDGILQGAVRNTIRNAIVANASLMTVDQIYGKDKAKLIEQARIMSSKYLEQYGLHIEQLFWASNIILPENIQNQINARVANEQQAIAEQAKVATAVARANAQREQARGQADAMQLVAEAARANPESIEIKIIEKWNGTVPMVIGSTGSVPFIGPQLSKRQ